MKRLKITAVLLSVCLVMSLTSCGKTPAPPPKLIVLSPPESTFVPCEKPYLTGYTWGDAVSYTLRLQTALDICANRVGILGAWRAGLPEREIK